MRHRQRAGFTLTEMIVAIAVVGIMASMVFPTLARARNKARQIQCTSQLRQLGQALMMYDMDYDRELENYPDRLTHLYALKYAPDSRVFVCPMDTTKATKNKAGRASLKPGTPGDDKADWAERVWNADTAIAQQNSSYLYEFSGRECQKYDPEYDYFREDSASTWCEDALVYWEDGLPWEMFFVGFEFTISNVDTDGARYVDAEGTYGIITWQEAKMWQLNNGDVYVTGIAAPGMSGIPSSWSDDPDVQINENYTASMQRNYARSWIPMLRCFWHMTPSFVDDEKVEEVLNLALDNNTFFSSPGWEQTAWKYGRVRYEDE